MRILSIRIGRSQIRRLLFLILIMWQLPAHLYADPNLQAWGEEASQFLLPLTYPDFNPTDFGTSQGREEMALLKRYKPKIYLAPGAAPPLDFYREYLPQCELKDSETGKVVIESPTRADLKKYERTHGYYLDYIGPRDYRGSPVAYGRVYRENIQLYLFGRSHNLPVIFIKYNFVFLASGLTAELPWYKRILVDLIGDPDWWHELDIHGAIIVAVIQKGKTYQPLGITLGQHNHFRTYLYGRDLPAPADGRPRIGFADRSNEPYPAPVGLESQKYAAVGNPTQFAFVLLGKGFHLTAGWDRVYGEKSGANPLAYTIQQLPDKDPLYVSWIPLGEKKGIIGNLGSFYRTGPPGIDLMTWPAISTYSTILQFWYVDDGDQIAAALFEEHFSNFYQPEFAPILEYNRRHFTKSLAQLHPDLFD